MDIKLKSGQILRPKKDIKFSIGKCQGPIESELWEGENSIETESFLFLDVFLKIHYIVIDGIYDNLIYPEHRFVIAYLITHSDNFENLKLTDNEILEHFETELDLNNGSYITRDKFFILTDNIDISKTYGTVNIAELKKALEY